MFTSSSHSNSPLYSFRFASKKASTSINFIKLTVEKQLTLQSFGQFLLININLFKLFFYNICFFNFFSILTKEKSLSFSMWDPTIPRISWARKTIVRNKDSCFLCHFRKHLMSFASTSYF